MRIYCMNITTITNIASFIQTHAKAWETFAKLAPGANIVEFGFVQDKGGWLAIDEKSGEHLFREYCGKIVALRSPFGLVIFQGDESIFC